MGFIPPSGYSMPIQYSTPTTAADTVAIVARCPAGTMAIGGGYAVLIAGVSTPSADVAVQRATPLDDFSGYRVQAFHPGGSSWQLQVTALCINARAG